MASKKEYTLEEQVAYWKKRASSKATKKPVAKGKGGRKPSTAKGKPKRASGCVFYPAGTWKRKDGSFGEVDKIWAWRYFGSGKNRRKMEMNAYPSKDGGKPQNGTSIDVCVCFVANVKIIGVSKDEYSAVWSQQYEKLTISDLDLVANPGLAGGGYFGPGGPKYKDKVK